METELHQGVAIDIRRQNSAAETLPQHLSKRWTPTGRTDSNFRPNDIRSSHLEHEVKCAFSNFPQRLVVELAGYVPRHVTDDKAHDFSVETAENLRN
jgi:hypothetical protein